MHTPSCILYHAVVQGMPLTELKVDSSSTSAQTTGVCMEIWSEPFSCQVASVLHSAPCHSLQRPRIRYRHWLCEAQHTCVNVRVLCACVHVRMCTCAYVYMCACVHVPVCTCVHVYLLMWYTAQCAGVCDGFVLVRTDLLLSTSCVCVCVCLSVSNVLSLLLEWVAKEFHYREVTMVFVFTCVHWISQFQCLSFHRSSSLRYQSWQGGASYPCFEAVSTELPSFSCLRQLRALFSHIPWQPSFLPSHNIVEAHCYVVTTGK